MICVIWGILTCTLKPTLKDKTKILMTNGSLMKVFLNVLGLKKTIFGLFLEWPFYTGFIDIGKIGIRCKMLSSHSLNFSSYYSYIYTF